MNLAIPSRRLRARGMTLLEVVVSTGLMALLVGLAFQISAHSTRSVSERVTRSNVEVKGERTLKLLTEDLISAAQLGIVSGTGNTQVDFFVPIVDSNGRGTVLQDSSESNPGFLRYGASTDGMENSGTMTFRFVPREVLAEGTMGIDLNGDGDKSDSYDMGYIERNTSLSGDVPRLVGVTNVIQVAGAANWGQPIVSSAGAESGKLFRLQNNGSILEINLWLLTVSEDRFPHLVQCSSQVFLRNQIPPAP
ncbi:MAG: hypothetical protein AMXMBFR7_20950 [Planctomycetota bacterium]